MKKIFFIFVLVFCLAAGFTETGYNGTQWWSNRQTVRNKLIYLITPPIENEDLEDYYEYVEIEKKEMLGVKTSVYYHFFDEALCAASYAIPAEKTKELKAKFKNKIKELDVELEVEEGPEIEEICTIENYVFNAMTMGDVDYFQMFKGKGAKISIYNYNDDTRVYIFEKTKKDTTFVVYAYYGQDY